MKETAYRRQLSSPTRTIILGRANQLLVFPLNGRRQVRKGQLPLLKSQVSTNPGLIMSLLDW